MNENDSRELSSVFIPREQIWHHCFFTWSTCSMKTVTLKGENKLFVMQFYHNVAACSKNKVMFMNWWPSQFIRFYEKLSFMRCVIYHLPCFIQLCVNTFTCACNHMPQTARANYRISSNKHWSSNKHRPLISTASLGIHIERSTSL